jgi:DNA-binding CsgD family transcriptional regulator
MRRIQAAPFTPAFRKDLSMAAPVSAVGVLSADALMRLTALPLSGRETQVLGLVAQGMRNKEIAGALGVSPETVQTHIKRLFVKLGVRGRTAAVTTAVARGIVHLPRPSDAATIGAADDSPADHRRPVAPET